MTCQFNNRRQYHFDERQRGEILTPAEKISRFERFLAAIEMTTARNDSRTIRFGVMGIPVNDYPL